MKSKAWLVMFTLVLFPLVLFANGNKEATKSDESVTKVTGVFDRILITENGQKEWGDAFYNFTGLKLDIVKPEHNQYSQILSTMFAAGDYPDLLEIQTNDYLTFATSGHLIPLEGYIEASENFKSVNKDLIEAYRLKDGHIYGVPTYDGGGCVTYIRKDWLDNLGLSVPTTWDEYYNVLKAFTLNDPDGNGQNDTVGLTVPFQTGYEFDYYNRMIMQDAFFGFENKNGKWVDGFLQPEMVEAIKRFKKLYDDGFLDNEFFTNKTSTARSKVYAGQAGVMEYWSGTWATRFDDSAKNSDPKAVVIPIKPIKNAYYINRVGPAFAITKAAKNPKVIFEKFLDTMVDNGAGQVLFTHGIEGMHYEMKDGKYVMMPEPSNPDRPFDKAFSDPTLVMNNWEPLVPSAELITLSQKIQKENSVQLMLPQGGKTYMKRVGEILTLKQQIFAEAINGTYTVEEAMNNYKVKAEELGLTAIIDELNN
ncbi:MAG: extracellular solute-binding protein [Spirochaetales bacterium]|nr:extracellular solute-binding protein [Spirochaetales bacterium]